MIVRLLDSTALSRHVRGGRDWRLKLRSPRSVTASPISALKQIIGLVMPENIASVRVLETTGLRYVETVSLWGKQFCKYLALPSIS